MSDIAGREELALAALERGSDERLGGIADDIALALNQTVLLELAYHVGDGTVVELDGVGHIEDVVVLPNYAGEGLLHARRHAGDGLVDAYSEGDDGVAPREPLVVDLAEDEVHDLLGEGLVARHADGVGRQVVANRTEDGLEVVRRKQVLTLEQADVLDALPVSRDVGDLVEEVTLPSASRLHRKRRSSPLV